MKTNKIVNLIFLIILVGCCIYVPWKNEFAFMGITKAYPTEYSFIFSPPEAQGLQIISIDGGRLALEFLAIGSSYLIILILLQLIVKKKKKSINTDSEFVSARMKKIVDSIKSNQRPIRPLKLWFDPTVMENVEEVIIFSVMTPDGKMDSNNLETYLLHKVERLIIEAKEDGVDVVRCVNEYIYGIYLSPFDTPLGQAGEIVYQGKIPNWLSNMETRMSSPHHKKLMDMTYEEALAIYNETTLLSFLECIPD